MNAREKQIREHVGRAAEKAGAFSFVYGRGWRAHRTMAAAERAARRDVAEFVKLYGGGEPQNLTAGALSAS